MTELTYERDITALLMIDPYNDFISEGGKVWDRLKPVAEANNCVANMLQVLEASRRAGLRVFYAMHHRYRPGDYETWKYVAPTQRAAWRRQTFAACGAASWPSSGCLTPTAAGCACARRATSPAWSGRRSPGACAGCRSTTSPWPCSKSSAGARCSPRWLPARGIRSCGRRGTAGGPAGTSTPTRWATGSPT
jgi:hypothetical protein